MTDPSKAAAAAMDSVSADVLLTIPFAGLLVSIALLPLLAPRFWEHRFAAVTALWSAAFVLPAIWVQGWRPATHDIVHALALDYIPFIVLIFALFVVAGGIRLVGNLRGDPGTNLTILATGTILASALGTTGAAMLLIRPLIRANEARRHTTHIFVFFIFLVANIGGSLTPLGDPPLFLGFLRGVEFTWTLRTMLGPMSVAVLLLLALFFAIDSWRWRTDRSAYPASRVPRQLRVDGGHNAVYLLVIIATVLISGLWHPGVTVPLGFGLSVPLEGAVRDGVLLLVGLLSWLTTPRRVRIENAFTWVPIQEVAILFLGIFITIIPVLGLLRAGPHGPAGPLLGALFRTDGTPIDWAFFWVAGTLSSFLDNAPTYLIFFNLAGGDPAALMGVLGRTLLAISMGAVFMGANSYLGNAPNFMIKAICEEQGVRMPSFFGFLAWSGGVLVPLFALLTFVFLV